MFNLVQDIKRNDAFRKLESISLSMMDTDMGGSVILPFVLIMG